MQVGNSDNDGAVGAHAGERLRRGDARLVPHLHAAAPAALALRVDLRPAHRRRRAARSSARSGLAYPELGVHPADEYLFGDDLLVAPVLDRGVTSRSVLFPPAAGSTGGPARSSRAARAATWRRPAGHAAALPAPGRHRPPAAPHHRHHGPHHPARQGRLVRHHPRRALQPRLRRRRPDLRVELFDGTRALADVSSDGAEFIIILEHGRPARRRARDLDYEGWRQFEGVRRRLIARAKPASVSGLTEVT